MADWYPHAVRVPANRASGPHDTSYPWRGVIHTTESSTYTPSTADYFGHSNYPHLTVHGTNVYQHLPLSQFAFALANELGGVETNRARAVQIEVVARAAQPDWPADLVITVAALMRWVEEQTGIKREAPHFVSYPSSYGLGAPQRMGALRWREFNGWCGHQHVAENSHGDPGAIPIRALLEDDMALSDDDKVWIAKKFAAVPNAVASVSIDEALSLRLALRRTERRTQQLLEMVAALSADDVASAKRIAAEVRKELAAALQ